MTSGWKIFVGLVGAAVLVLLAMQFKSCGKTPDSAPDPLPNEPKAVAMTCGKGQQWSKTQEACVCISTLKMMDESGDCICNPDVATIAADGSCKAKSAPTPPTCTGDSCSVCPAGQYWSKKKGSCCVIPDCEFMPGAGFSKETEVCDCFAGETWKLLFREVRTKVRMEREA